MLRADVGPQAALSILLASFALAGCNSSASPPVAVAAAPTTPQPPSAGVVGTVIGQSLDDSDKERAVIAQNEAVNAGVRKAWRGAHGTYGFIVPGPENATCRDYTHKIFINGRAQEAKGQACRTPDGGWRVTS
jgi:surface antigen